MPRVPPTSGCHREGTVVSFPLLSVSRHCCPWGPRRVPPGSPCYPHAQTEVTVTWTPAQRCRLAGTRGLGHHGFLPAAPCASKIKVISHCHPAQLSPTARAPDHSPRPGTAGPGSRCSWPQAAEKLLPLLHCLCSSFPSSKSLGQHAALGGDCHPLLPAEDQGRVQQRLKHFPSLWEWREGHPI